MKEMVKKRTDSGTTVVGNLYRLYILADINGWRGNRTRAGITGTFGVPGKNNNG